MKRQDARNAKTLEEPGKELVEYKGHRVGEGCLDLLVSDRVVVEPKAVEVLAPIHWVHGIDRSSLKATGSLSVS